MYRGAALACPACRGSLEYSQASLPIHGCRACGGLWLGPDATMHVLQGRGGALEREVVDVDRRSSLPPTIAPAVPNSAIRRCPACDLEMAPLGIGAVRVDSCPAHGTWFDRLELTRVTKELADLERARTRRRAEAALPSLDDFVQDTKALAFGAVAIPAQLLEWVSEWLAETEHPRDCRCHECLRMP